MFDKLSSGKFNQRVHSDVMLKMEPDNQSFGIYLRILGDKMVGKRFNHPFKAAHLNTYLEGWMDWSEVTGDELVSVENVERKMKKQ